MNISGKSRKIDGSPYSRGIAVAGGVGTPAFPVDMTTLSLNPSAASQPVGESFRSGARHGTTGVLVFATTGGVLVYKDAAGVSTTIDIVGGAALPPTALPFCMTEITSFAGATGRIIAYWDD